MAFATQPAGVSILLCTYNGATRIAETLTCLAAQRLKLNTQWEVILVDNASTDTTTELARQVWDKLGAPTPMRILHEARQGKQYALETAVSQAQFRYTCIVDDDNRLASDYLLTGLDLLDAHPQIGILGGPNTATFEIAEPTWFADFQRCYAVGPQLDRAGGNVPLADGNAGRNALWGAGMFVRTAVWHELRAANFQSLFSGRLGESNLTAGEDDELCYAAQLLGYEVWYSSKLHLQHHMTAGRLTSDYRNRLFYDSARTTARLNAYYDALWGKKNSTTRLNFIKDTAFLVKRLAAELISLRFWRAIIKNDYIAKMTFRHQLIALQNTLIQGRWGKAYYEPVAELKRRVAAQKSSHV